MIQIKIDKIHGDAIGGKEVEGERSIATLTQSVGIPIYDKDLRISADDLKIGDIVELSILILQLNKERYHLLEVMKEFFL